MGSLLGLAVGFLLGSSRFLAVVFEPYVMAFYGIPRIALAPIFIIVLGIGIWSKVAVVFIQVFFMLFINAYAGVREINQEFPPRCPSSCWDCAALSPTRWSEPWSENSSLPAKG
jgi:ABC-type nitrate/sulfonate/bicarbonate transport system permease component